MTAITGGEAGERSASPIEGVVACVASAVILRRDDRGEVNINDVKGNGVGDVLVAEHPIKTFTEITVTVLVF